MKSCCDQKMFLFEIYSEEIPARMQKDACILLTDLAQKHFEKQEMLFEACDVFVSANRLVLSVRGASCSTKSLVHKGPAVIAGEKAKEAFAKSLGIPKEACEIQSFPKGDFFVALVLDQRPIQERLAKVCQDILTDFVWPKSMRFKEDCAFQWVRPLRHLLCLYDHEQIDFTFEPLKMKTTRVTKGLKSLTTPSIEIHSASSYMSQLLKEGVFLSQIERQEAILDQLDHHCFLEHLWPFQEDIDISKPSSLIQEVCGLTESPFVLTEKFDTSFLEMPECLIRSALVHHQKCFPLKHQATEKISDTFAVVTSLPHPSESVRKGYQRVIKARLADAAFFWKQDASKPLESYNAILEKRVFFEGLGSFFNKVQRCIQLADLFPDVLLLQEVALLSKADLATKSVYEFPELQGQIGSDLALFQKKDPRVVKALSEQYFPKAESSREEILSISLLGAAFSVLDRLDTLVGFFAKGQVPTSSKDPFALRRQAYGLVRLLTYHPLDLFLPTAIEKSLSLYKAQGYLDAVSKDFPENLIQFCNERFITVAEKEEGVESCYLKGALSLKGSFSFSTQIQKAKEYQDYFSTQQGQKFLSVYKRGSSFIKDPKEFLALSIDYEMNDFEKKLLPLLSLKEKPTLTALENITQDLENFFNQVRILEGPFAMQRCALLYLLDQHFNTILGPLSFFV